MGELIWKPVAGTFGKYWVSEYGDIMSKYREYKDSKFYRDSVIKPSSNGKKKRYLKISLRYRDDTGVQIFRSSSIHRLVALAFVPIVEGKPHVNHIDGNKLNNHYTNLEWCTPQENNEHGVRLGLLKRGRKKREYIKKGRLHLKKKVINVVTREIYDDAKEVAMKEGFSHTYFMKQLRGDRINKTEYRYVGFDESFIRKKPKLRNRFKVAVFDNNGVFVGNYDSVKDAAKYIGASGSEIYFFLKGERGSVKGFKFKKIAADGSLIEPPIFKYFIRPPKKIVIKKPPIPPLSVIKYDISGNELNRFPSIRAASLELGVRKDTFKKSVQRSPTGYYKGNRYKILYL